MEYIAIDLKSFYASVECILRGWDPLKTNLVVADNSRGDGTICLAVSPSLKEFGVSSRPRLFEAKKQVSDINLKREYLSKDGILWNKSIFKDEILNDDSCEVDFYIATPQMQKYLDISAQIYKIYLKYISHEDIHVYSIDEVFINVTPYLSYYKKTAHEIAIMIIRDVLKETGITATVGIGENMFLAKVAMDIVAKHMKADKNGVRIASLNKYTFREKLWSHKPLTDIWKIGPGISKRLLKYNITCLGELARFSIKYEDVLFDEFGINAQLLIDHAWGEESTTISDIKKYKPKSKSISQGQVLPQSYSYDKALLIAKEMADTLALTLVKRNMQTTLISFYVGYDKHALKDHKNYTGKTSIDYDGNLVPISPSVSYRLKHYTSSASEIMQCVSYLFTSIVNPLFKIRRIGISACDVISYNDALKIENQTRYIQMDMFTNYDILEQNEFNEKRMRNNDYTLTKTLLNIKNKYGKNAVFKGLNLEEDATSLERNRQIGGHKA